MVLLSLSRGDSSLSELFSLLLTTSEGKNLRWGDLHLRLTWLPAGAGAGCPTSRS